MTKNTKTPAKIEKFKKLIFSNPYSQMADIHRHKRYRYRKYQRKPKQTCIYDLPPEIMEIILRQTSYKDLLNVIVTSKKMSVHVYHILRKIFD